MKVSYDKDVRERAMQEQMGLVTVETIAPGERPGKLGGRITHQQIVSAKIYKEVTDFMVNLIVRTGKQERGRSKKP